jgi:hypothetical protein
VSAQEFAAVAGSKPAELLRRAIAARLDLVKTRLCREQEVTQLHRLQGRALELEELLVLLKTS